MRRILRDYFGYEVNFVMNITDVDDKVSPLPPSVSPSHARLTLPSRPGRLSSALANLTSSPTSSPPTSPLPPPSTPT